MAFRDDVLTILAGGLPALVDGGSPDATSTPQPERIPPEPQLQDRETFLQGGGMLNSTNILLMTAVVVGAIGLVAFIRR